MKSSVRREIDRLLRGQYEVIHVRQAMFAGLSPDQIRYIAETQEWEPIHRGVYRTASSPPSFEQRLMAACLAAGATAVASHRAAAWMWQLIPAAPDRPELSVPLEDHPRVPGVKIHRSRDLDPRRTIYRRNIPCTDPLRAIVDLAAVTNVEITTTAVDRSLASGLLTMPALSAELLRRSIRGRPGVRAVRSLLTERGMIGGPEPSALEAEAVRFFERWSIPVLDREIKAGPDGRYRLDFLLTPTVAVEFDGYAYHWSPEAKTHDEARRNQLRLDGIFILVYTWRDLRFAQRRVAGEIMDALRQHSA